MHERLQQKRMELLGRVETELERPWESRRPLPAKFVGAAPAPAAAPAFRPQRWVVERRPLEEVLSFVREGREVWVTSGSFKKEDKAHAVFDSQYGEHFVRPRMTMNYMIKAVKEHKGLGTVLLVCPEDAPDRPKYTLAHALCLWEVLRPLVLQGQQVAPSSYLRLSCKVDDEAPNCQIWEVELWSRDVRPLKGALDLRSPDLRPMIMVRKGDLP